MLVSRATELALPVRAQERPDRMVIQEERINDSPVWRFTIRHPAIPEELGFLVADIAVNARSCLDMAMQNLADRHCQAWSRPQFPIVDAVDDQGRPAVRDRHFETAMRLLPVSIAEAVRLAQPRYDLGDLPTNSTALLIRDLSNANKHRNLTPVIRAKASWGFGHPNVPGGDQLRMLETDENPWADDPETVMVVVPPPGMPSSVALEISPMVSFTTKIDAGPDEGIRLRHAPDHRVSFRLEDLLRKVPKYARLTLRNLAKAEACVISGAEELPWFDRSATL